MLDAPFQDLGWREKAALKSFPSLFSKEVGVSFSLCSFVFFFFWCLVESTYYKCLTQMLDALNGTTTASDSNPLSIEAIRKKDPSLSWRVEDEVESHASSEVDLVSRLYISSLRS